MIAKKPSFHIQIVRASFVLFIIVFIGIIAFSEALIIKDKRTTNLIYPNVYIDNVNFGHKSKNDIINFYDKKNKKFEKIAVTVIYDKLPIATFSGQLLRLRYNGRSIADRAYLIGRSPNTPSRLYQKIVSLFNLSRFDFTSTPEYDKSYVTDYISNQEEKYNFPAKNALFTFENGRVVNFRQEERGQSLESDAFYNDFETAMLEEKKKFGNKFIVLRKKIIEPEIKLSQANNFGIEELIAVGKSDYTHSIPGRVHNVILATSKFNGVLIPRGETFSFNDTVGDISGLTGYQQAYIIKNGKTVLGDGGGVCQVSTTLFRAALNAGLPIVERTAHAYRVGYYENDLKPGFDATVFAPSVDLKIKNDTPAHILVQTEIDENNNLLFFKFYGKKDTRKVEISSVTIYDQSPAPNPLYQDDPVLKKGVVKQVDFAAAGAKVFFSYRIVNGSKITETKFFSVYRPWQAVFLVGQAD